MTTTSPNPRRRPAAYTAALAALLVPAAALAVPAVATPSVDAVVLVDEVYGGGGNSGGAFDRDFVELYNPTDEPVSLDGWSVQYGSATGTTWSGQTNLTGQIPAGGSFSWRRPTARTPTCRTCRRRTSRATSRCRARAPRWRWCPARPGSPAWARPARRRRTSSTWSAGAPRPRPTSGPPRPRDDERHLGVPHRPRPHARQRGRLRRGHPDAREQR